MTPTRGRALLLWSALLAGLAFTHRQVFLGKVMAGRDAFRLFMPDSAFLLQSLRALELPLWNPHVRLGQPFAATLHSEAFYLPHLLTTGLFGPYIGFTVHHALHVAAAAAGMFLLARRMRVSRAGAVLAGAAFGLSPMLADLHGQRNVVDAACWTPFILLGALRLAAAPSVRSAGLVALAFAGSFLCGSPETLLWQIAVAAVVFFSRAERPRQVSWLALGGVWAMGLAGLVLLPAAELALNSTRTSGFFEGPLEWSTSPAQVASLAIPFADHPRDMYWGRDQWFVVTIFAGTLVCALACAAVRRSRRVLPLAGAGAVLLLISMGRHFPSAGLLWELPPLNMFRYPAKYLVGVLFVVSLLAGMGVDRLVVMLRRRRASARAAALAVGGTLLLLAAVLPLSRLPLFRSGLQSGVLWAVLALGVVAAAGLAIGPRRRRAVLVGGALLELAAYHALMIRTGWVPPSRLRQPSVLAAAIPRPFEGRISVEVDGPGLDDVLNPGEGPGLEQSRDALVANRFMEEGLSVPEGYGAPEPELVQWLHRPAGRTIHDLTGVSYYVRDGPPPYPDLERVAGGDDGLPALYRSSTAMPRAFVVHEARVLGDEVVLTRLREPEASALFRRVAMLAEGKLVTGTGCQGSSARIVHATSNAVEVEAVACQEAYLVLADSYYPGWSAEVDGAKVDVVRADYALRAVPLRPGTHRVTFRYRPASFGIGLALTVAATVALAAAFGRRRRAGAT
jgi:hypothetical protein